MGRMKLIVLFFVVGLLLLTTFNNCGKVNVQQLSSEPAPAIGGSVKINYITVPELPDQQLRAVFLLDMSRSMLYGPCGGSIDTMITGVTPVVNCNAWSGVDNAGNRFKLIREWIDQVQFSINQGVLRQDQVKLMLVPFTGGMQDVMLKSFVQNLPAYKKFSSVTDFLSILNRLEALYIRATTASAAVTYPPYIAAADAQVLNGFTQGGVLSYFGTSVPAPRMDYINTAVAEELALMNQAGLTRSAQFEVVYISDGVAKPRPDHLMAAVEFIWKAKKMARLQSSGMCIDPQNWNWQSGEPCWEWKNYDDINLESCINQCKIQTRQFAEDGKIPGYGQPCYDCFQALKDYDFDPASSNSGYSDFAQQSKTYWGDWQENSLARVLLKFSTLVNVYRRNSDTRFRFNFIRLDSAVKAFEVPAVELTTITNWINKAREVYAKGHRYVVQKEAQAQFSLFKSLKNNERYQVNLIYAINLNARTNSYGALELDSDGDGLQDALELELGFNPANPRSDGACLDSIKYQMKGCIKVGCDNNVDVDGDGLNECEERTMGTDLQDFDTDGDGISDSHEVLFRLNPLDNDQFKNSSADGLTNLAHFLRGAVSDVALSDVPANRLVHFSANLKDQRLIKDSRGRTVNSPGYTFELKNVPLVNTLKATDTHLLFRSKAKLPEDASTFSIIGGSHSLLSNRVLFMIRIDSLDNPGDSFWVMMEKNLQFNPDKVQNIEINFDSFKGINVVDPYSEVKP